MSTKNDYGMEVVSRDLIFPSVQRDLTLPAKILVSGQFFNVRTK